MARCAGARFTFGTQLGVDAGGTGPDRLLVRGRSALLVGSRLGFAGVEMIADVGHTISSAIAPEFALDVPVSGFPVRLALAVPFRLDAPHGVGMITAVSTDLR